MAIKKDIITSQGIKADHHVIHTMWAGKGNKRAYIIVYLYATENYKGDNGKPKYNYLEKYEFDIEENDFNDYFTPEKLKLYDDLYEAGYVYLVENIGMYANSEKI